MFVTGKRSSLFYSIVSDDSTSDKLFLFGEKESFLTLTTRVDPIKKFAWQSSSVLLFLKKLSSLRIISNNFNI